ncbi:MAG: FAD-binding oxidoreductase [Chloroflexi bacterium]|nr:FAD-binding oxidoreductase [Chloroflexota bacterium]
MTLSETADAIICGGGVIGVSMAYYLARRKLGRIVVLERETLGSGSTGRSVASLDLFSHQPAAIALQVRAYEVFAHFAEVFGEECGLVTSGFAVLAGPEHTAALQKAAMVTAAAGVELRLLSPPEFAELEPAAAVSDLTSVCYVPAGGYADPMLTTHGFATAARRAGVIIQQGRAVTSLRREGDCVTGVETSAGPIAAPIVVSAAGPWSGRLLKAFGLDDLGLFACRHPVIAMQHMADFGRSHLSILDLPHQIYARPETGYLTLAGSMDPRVGYDPVEPEEDHGGVTEDYTLWVAERLVQRYPALEAGALRQGWSGLMTISPDWQPVLGALPGVSGLYCATGFSGQGFKISPAVGDLMAGLIAGEAEAAELLTPFRPARFAEGQALASSEFGALG